MNNNSFDDDKKYVGNDTNNSVENTGFGNGVANEGFFIEEDFDLSSNDSDFLDLNSYSSDEDAIGFDIEKSDNKPKKKNKKKKGPKRVFKAVLKVFLVFFLIGTILATTVGAAGFVWFAGVEPYDQVKDIDLKNLDLNYSTTIYVKNANSEWVEYQRLHATENRIPVKYNKDKADANDPSYDGIPKNLANAYVAVEDKRFFDHEGVDWKRTLSAFVTMVTTQSTSGHGGSSITQQLIKNLTNIKDRSAMRKIVEIKSALYIEGKFSKETILEAYMNTIAMGNGLCGVESAAKYYFGKSVSELTLSECASLAGITNSPESYRPDTKLENNLKRRNIILGLMREQGYITEKEYKDAIAEELVILGDKSVLKEVEINNYFVDALIDDVVADLMEEYSYSKSEAQTMFYNGGFKIYATIDTKVQETMESVYKSEEFLVPSAKTGAPIQGSMVVMDYSGHILGIVGGMGEKTENRGLNRATMSPRQPGSTMKPIAAYAPAIENDLITYSSIIADVKRTYAPSQWWPRNWYGGHKGNVTAKFALEYSINSVPVHLVDLLTPQKSYDFLTKSLGVKNLTAEDINYSPLGMGGTNGGLTTRESAAAYAIFGNGGKYYEPVTYVQVLDHKGDVVLSTVKDPIIAISEESSVIMNKMLQNVVYGPSGTGRGVSKYIYNTRVYAKTGTSDSSNDLWFVGGTPYYVGSSWCGYDQQESIPSNKAGIAQNMWGSVMQKLHEGLPKKEFFTSNKVICKPFCNETGLLAKSGCPTSAYGWYKTSNASYCTAHGGDNVTGTTEGEAKSYIGGLEKTEDKAENSSSQASSTTSGTGSSSNSSSSSSGVGSGSTTASSGSSSTTNTSSSTSSANTSTSSPASSSDSATQNSSTNSPSVTTSPVTSSSDSNNPIGSSQSAPTD